jgi:carboxymethylenebutenolidase
LETEGTLSSVWDQHLASEFAAKSADQALATMPAEPYVNEVPLMIGARGREELHDFYANHFLNQIPPDLEMVTVSRTIGQGRVVDELIARFTHSIRMDWLLPGIAPTGRRVELPLVVIVQFEGDKPAHEHLYWDQAFGAGPGRPPRSHVPRPRRRDRGAGAQPDATDERAHPSRGEQDR